MSGDIVYALLFPQLTAAMYMPEYVNWFGSTCAFFVGVILRFLSGEPFLGIDAYIHWPGFISGKYNKKRHEYFTFFLTSLYFVTLFSTSWANFYATKKCQKSSFSVQSFWWLIRNKVFNAVHSVLTSLFRGRLANRWTQANVHVPHCFNDYRFRCFTGHLTSIWICPASTRSRNKFEKSGWYWAHQNERPEWT